MHWSFTISTGPPVPSATSLHSTRATPAHPGQATSCRVVVTGSLRAVVLMLLPTPQTPRTHSTLGSQDGRGKGRPGGPQGRSSAPLKDLTVAGGFAVAGSACRRVVRMLGDIGPEVDVGPLVGDADPERGELVNQLAVPGVAVQQVLVLCLA